MLNYLMHKNFNKNLMLLLINIIELVVQTIRFNYVE